MEIASRRREQEVWQACDDLWALYGEMGSLTGDAIRERLVMLGKSRGSPNEIYKYRKSWTLSRGVEKEKSETASPLDSDPITRAVRLVHEKLHSEAQEEIDKLKQEFHEQLEQKQLKIQECKADLEALFQEMTALQNEYARLNSARAELEQKLSIEIDVRKAVEQELSREKQALLIAQEAKERLLQELKNAHKEALVHVQTAYAHNEEVLKERCVALEASKSQLGLEFSESINSLKLEKLQQEAKLKNTLERSLELEDALVATRRRVHEQDTKFKTMLEETLRYKALFEATKASRDELMLDIFTLKSSHDSIKRELVKRDVIIARLRALLAHRVESHEPTYQRAVIRAKRRFESQSDDPKVSHSCT